jgi:thiamine-phosphate pyrophosphorylase
MRLRGLYAITPQGGDLERRVREALEGGIALLQYRGKPARKDEAAAIVRLAEPYGVPVTVNDDVDLALEVGAAGAHLGRADGDWQAARRRLGAKILGVSCYDDPGLARRAMEAHADYIAFGSVFPSPTKPQAVRAPLRLFSDFRRFGVPLAAIGGITLENAPQLIAAGADLLAVISDLFDASDIRGRARDYGRLFA